MGENGVVGGEAVVFSLVGEVLIGPYLPHDLDGLPEQFPVLRVLPWVGVGVKLGTLVGPDPPAEADLNPTLGQVSRIARSSANLIGCHQGAMLAICPMRIRDVRAARSAPSSIGLGRSPIP